MSVVRVQKRRDRFTVLSTATLRRTSLSLKARGLWALCMSYPDDWHFRTSHLQAQSDGDGRGAVRSALRELEEAGLAALETPRGEDGRLLGKRWTIYEEAALNPAREGVDVGDENDRETENPVVGPSAAHRQTGFPSDGSPESRSDRRTAHPPLRNNKQHGAPRKRTSSSKHASAAMGRRGMLRQRPGRMLLLLFRVSLVKVPTGTPRRRGSSCGGASPGPWRTTSRGTTGPRPSSGPWRCTTSAVGARVRLRARGGWWRPSAGGGARRLATRPRS